MDTDDLSTEAYKGILYEAERFSHDLTLHFGVLSYQCKNESEYLAKAKELITLIRQLAPNQLEELFFGSPPDEISLLQTLDKISENIIAVEKIPESKRHYDF